MYFPNGNNSLINSKSRKSWIYNIFSTEVPLPGNEPQAEIRGLYVGALWVFPRFLKRCSAQFHQPELGINQKILRCPRTAGNVSRFLPTTPIGQIQRKRFLKWRIVHARSSINTTSKWSLVGFVRWKACLETTAGFSHYSAYGGKTKQQTRIHFYDLFFPSMSLINTLFPFKRIWGDLFRFSGNKHDVTRWL